MPPSWAMAMARRDSVTVSMAADTRGMLSWIPRVNCVVRRVSRGRTWEKAGTRRTSSKVRAFLIRRMDELRTKIDYSFSRQLSPRVAEHPHPRRVAAVGGVVPALVRLTPAFGPPGHHDVARDAFRMRHHDGVAAVGR